jgi:hypothetical protein
LCFFHEFLIRITNIFRNLNQPDDPAEDLVQVDDPADDLTQVDDPADDLTQADDPADDLAQADDPVDLTQVKLPHLPICNQPLSSKYLVEFNSCCRTFLKTN